MDHTATYRADDGTDIWYGTSGEGPPLVLCDGLACDGFIWPYLIDAFIDDYEIVRWHYPAHGRSGTPPDLSTLTVERFARDLRGILDALELEEVALAGHSMGVQVVLEAFREMPDRIRALAPMCGSYKRPLDTFHNSDALRQALPYLRGLVDTVPATTQAVWKRLITSRFSKLVATLSETNPRLMRSKDIDPYLEHAAEMDVDVFVTLLENIADHSAEPLLADIDVPTLIIAGDSDTFTPLFRSREMADMIPDAELVVVSGGTHVVPLEAPDLLHTELDAFLTSAWDRET